MEEENLVFSVKECCQNLGIPAEAVIYFEYGKREEGYWTREHLLDQIIKKTLVIREALYPSYYILSFLFDKAISHTIYITYALSYCIC